MLENLMKPGLSNLAMSALYTTSNHIKQIHVYMTYVETTTVRKIKHKHRVYVLKAILIVGNKSQWMGVNTSS